MSPGQACELVRRTQTPQTIRRIDPILYEAYSSGMKNQPKIATRGAEEARQNLPAILAAAHAGESTLITRHGRAVAAVVPAAAVKQAAPVSLLTVAGSGKGMWGKRGTTDVARMRDEWSR